MRPDQRRYMTSSGFGTTALQPRQRNPPPPPLHAEMRSSIGQSSGSTPGIYMPNGPVKLRLPCCNIYAGRRATVLKPSQSSPPPPGCPATVEPSPLEPIWARPAHLKPGRLGTSCLRSSCSLASPSRDDTAARTTQLRRTRASR
jgi:hypothetical protein